MQGKKIIGIVKGRIIGLMKETKIRAREVLGKGKDIVFFVKRI